MLIFVVHFSLFFFSKFINFLLKTKQSENIFKMSKKANLFDDSEEEEEYKPEA